MEKDKSAGLKNRGYIRRFDSEGLIGIGQCGCPGRYGNAADNIPCVYGPGGGAGEKRKLKAAKELQRIGPRFKRAALISQKSEPSSGFVKGSSRFGRPFKADGALFNFEGRDGILFLRIQKIKGKKQAHQKYECFFHGVLFIGYLDIAFSINTSDNLSRTEPIRL